MKAGQKDQEDSTFAGLESRRRVVATQRKHMREGSSEKSIGRDIVEAK
ncbi:MAG: hypothetical protein KAV87_30220 [Desulfobacteraceae bacterium]|nr:hypothetical protein [Desulfobacteraceae bacterium]